MANDILKRKLERKLKGYDKKYHASVNIERIKKSCLNIRDVKKLEKKLRKTKK